MWTKADHEAACERLKTYPAGLSPYAWGEGDPFGADDDVRDKGEWFKDDPILWRWG